MSIKWTAEQQQVISHRGSNLLVSAAAGSGKTAVLVERIIRMVTDPDHPRDIDSLLVMTFTNAAAAQMRERIGAAIEKRLEEHPEDGHLQMQASLVHHAKITTIDSFCLNLIRDYFNHLELDPSFRVGDEGELMLLRQDAMSELLEDSYAENDEEFVRFVDTFGLGRDDSWVEEYILKVYAFAQSNPFPALWFRNCREELYGGERPESRVDMEADGSGDMEAEAAGPGGGEEKAWEDFPWMRFLMQDVHLKAGELSAWLGDALEICREDEYLCAYEPMLTEDIRQLEALCAAESFEEVFHTLSGFTWSTLARVRTKDVDPEKKAYVTGCRDLAKKAVKKLQEGYAFAKPEQMRRDMQDSDAPIRELLKLAEEFAGRYQEKKRERNLVDFNDLEHEALKVLIRQDADGLPLMENGGYVYTEVADELSRQYEEVMVDEYQDSNLVQEALIHAVSRERFGQPNIFMVGDVKQSIYKFRLACPELFLEKYHSYSSGPDTGGRMIELHQNFRSRSQVLDGINDIFYQIMTENLGGIRYTEGTALHAGAVFAPFPERPGEEAQAGPDEAVWPGTSARAKEGFPELLMVDTGKEAFAGLDDDAADYTAKEIEAKLIAAKIREFTDPEHGIYVWDKDLGESGGYRTAQYRDMVILLRSTAGWSETFLSVLMNEGIPAYAESRMGYFNTTEVETVLSFLSVIDNPMQDIPLAAVLHSPIVGITDEELAEIMANYRNNPDKGQDRGIYAAVQAYLDQEAVSEARGLEPEKAAPLGPDGDNGGDPAAEGGDLRKRLLHFVEMLLKFRKESIFLPIHELLDHIYAETGYYHYAAAMPAGKARLANLDMLAEKAAAYEKTSYKGLFHFIRYIKNLKKYHTDFGEASVSGEGDNTVRVMSIHKSKGLEFPIVFLAGLGKKFNRQDIRSRILIDPELGVGTDYLDLKYRLKAPTLKKNVLARKLEIDALGEELRVFYVAMTRAKERLVMTGTDPYLGKKLEKYSPGQIPSGTGQVPYTLLSGAGSCLDWVLMGIAGAPQVSAAVSQIPIEEIIGEEVERQMGYMRSRERLTGLDLRRIYDPEEREMLDRYLDYVYPCQADISLHAKMTVSELKVQGQMIDEEESARLMGEGMPPDTVSEAAMDSLPGSPSKPFEERFSGADIARRDFGATRGTAYHRALELIPFDAVHSVEEVRSCLVGMTEQKKYGRENLNFIDYGAIWQFLQSGLGQRMAAAARAGKLHREQRFVMGIPAREIGDYDSDELIVIQGIIDAYFEEDGGLVLVDYKTDKVRTCGELIIHYQAQLDYYERALAQMTGKAVKEKIIYSLTLQKEICVPPVGTRIK